MAIMNGGVFFVLFAYLFVLAIPVLIGVYVYRDAKQRGMDAVLWTLIAIFAPSLIGFVVYLVVRGKYSVMHCPGCGEKVEQSYARCPNCGAALQNVCPACEKPVDAAWKVCPHCGASLPEDMKPIVKQPVETRLPGWLLAVVIAIPVLLIVVTVLGLLLNVTV